MQRYSNKLLFLWVVLRGFTAFKKLPKDMRKYICEFLNEFKFDEEEHSHGFMIKQNGSLVLFCSQGYKAALFNSPLCVKDLVRLKLYKDTTFPQTYNLPTIAIIDKEIAKHVSSTYSINLSNLQYSKMFLRSDGEFKNVFW